MTTQTAVPVTLFFDYSCPFCYVASYRLERLNARYGLEILWRFVEANPACSITGEAAEERTDRLLEDLLAREDLRWHAPRYTTNTRRALLLAQTVQLYRRERFLPLHRGLFNALFAEGRNIGDEAVLHSLALAHGVDDLLPAAWGTTEPVAAFLSHVEAARELKLANIPALVVAGKAFPGAVSTDFLEGALQQAAIEG